MSFESELPIGEDYERYLMNRFDAEGTHNGEFFGVPATGKPVKISGINIMRIADGKIAEHWVQYDIMGMMQQIGAIPS